MDADFSNSGIPAGPMCEVNAAESEVVPPTKPRLATNEPPEWPGLERKGGIAELPLLGPKWTKPSTPEPSGTPAIIA